MDSGRTRPAASARIGVRNKFAMTCPHAIFEDGGSSGVYELPIPFIFKAQK
jgi:hypothetical protein